MKKLSQVSYDDAIEIIKAGYPQLFMDGRWILKSVTIAGEEEKELSRRSKRYIFQFDGEGIGIYDQEIPMLETTYFDVHPICYVKAFELGYEVSAFNSLNIQKQLGEKDEYIRSTIQKGVDAGLDMYGLKEIARDMDLSINDQKYALNNFEIRVIKKTE